jgi:hypothetical protein
VRLDHDIELSLPFGLVRITWPDGVHSGHVLHDDETELVSRIVEKVGFNLDVLAP